MLNQIKEMSMLSPNVQKNMLLENIQQHLAFYDESCYMYNLIWQHWSRTHTWQHYIHPFQKLFFFKSMIKINNTDIVEHDCANDNCFMMAHWPALGLALMYIILVNIAVVSLATWMKTWFSIIQRLVFWRAFL